ncbi:MAG: formylglycine-generating enzyme family protein [Chromatiales bacterium]|nr:formylglycine-generating enzyme family protein [Chromatiales bacterium]
MSRHELLSHLNGLHQMMSHLLEASDEADCYRCFEPALPPIAWLFGRAVYLETYWLREVILGDDSMTARVRHLFGHNITPDEVVIQQLPPKEHLLNWALELQEQNLTLLANPAQLPQHKLMKGERLLFRLQLEEGELCEAIIAQLTASRLTASPGYQVQTPLTALPPSEAHADVHKGHYRIGAKHEDPSARDNELPPNIVELHAFRIDTQPVSNGAFLGFIEAGGYDNDEFWSEGGKAWRSNNPKRPHHWRKDLAGNWYGLGLNGPFDLIAEDALTGISHHEATAYANWVSTLGGQLAGAVVQHEYQWEIAVRARAITEFGRVWEWCSNPFHRYDGYLEPEDPEAATQSFDDGHFSLRGGSLHSQKMQRRSSHRHHALPEDRFRFSGTRLVFPGSQMAWHKS